MLAVLQFIQLFVLQPRLRLEPRRIPRQLSVLSCPVSAPNIHSARSMIAWTSWRYRISTWVKNINVRRETKFPPSGDLVYLFAFQPPHRPEHRRIQRRLSVPSCPVYALKIVTIGQMYSQEEMTTQNGRIYVGQFGIFLFSDISLLIL